jgi:hypothetical protein
MSNFIFRKIVFLLVLIFLSSEVQADSDKVRTLQSYELKGIYNKVETSPGWHPVPKYSDKDCDDLHTSNSINANIFKISWGPHPKPKILNPTRESVIFEACITGTSMVLNEINSAFLLAINRSTKDEVRLYFPQDRIHLEAGKSIRVKWRTLNYLKNYSGIYEISNDNLYAKSLHVMYLTVGGDNFNSGGSSHKDFLGSHWSINSQFFPIN